MLTFTLRLLALMAAAWGLMGDAAFAQTPTVIKDSISLQARLFTRGDTVVVGMDSAYIANKKTYKLLLDTYKRMQNQQPAYIQAFKEYENLTALQDSMLKAKEGYYKQLKAAFDSLNIHTNSFINRTDVNVNKIDQSLDKATENLNNIKLAIDSSLVKLKDQNKHKVKLAVGGFVIGVGVTALIFLIAK
ncbi:hypothetical protein SAMN05421788_10354 [Filimonas lacunae]|uniref:Four helix bundle sensory module for signal transduction n=1 Tax=Filimonas lacunae TaxID=477680 RepID=A0A173MJ99_9BACT|nr:hypothetical protein [Filimonas lacunae]BAV07705.1 hypothetical protein FLA_3736 [Filimonas lacunae]SIT03779.1 hypothetical protein SAMN05421788_10354 [Filimonas lacunae]